MQCTVWPLKVSGRDSRKRFASLALSHRLLGRDQRRRTLCSRPPPTGIVGGEGDGHTISASKSLIFLGSGTFYATMLTSLHMLTPYVVSCHSYRWIVFHRSICVMLLDLLKTSAFLAATLCSLCRPALAHRQLWITCSQSALVLLGWATKPDLSWCVCYTCTKYRALPIVAVTTMS